MSDNSTSFAPPGESSADLWLERSNFSGSLLGGVAYGVHFSVFAATVYLMTRPSTRKISRLFFAFVWTMLVLGTIQVGCNTKFYEMMFIDDRNIPGGPNAWLETHFDVAVNVIGSTAFVVANFLADGVLLYRLLLVWNNNYFVVAIPFLAYLASTGLSLFSRSARPGASLWSHITVIFALPYWSLTIALNILMTLGIALRLLMLRRAVIKTLGAENSKMYTSIASIVIESGALYSITAMVFIICYARNSNVQYLVLPVLDQVLCFAPDIILLRMALGRAWSREISAHVSQSARLPIKFKRSDGSTLHPTPTSAPISNLSGTLVVSSEVGGSTYELSKAPNRDLEEAA